MFYCKFLNLPLIPQDIISSQSCNNIIREFPGRVCKIGDIEFTASNGVYYHADDNLNQWVRDNINLNIDLVGIRHQYGSADRPCHGAHTDATRDYALLYMVDNGGGYLKFWKKSDCPIEFDSVQLISDYDDMTELETVETPNGSWYLVNGRVIHSVENMLGTRITIQVNLKSL